MPKYTFQILEEQPIGTILTTLQATDVDSNIDEYHLAPNEYFKINNSTGSLLFIYFGIIYNTIMN